LVSVATKHYPHTCGGFVFLAIFAKVIYF